LRVPAIVLALVAAAGCAAVLARPTAEDARRATFQWPDATLDELKRGREIYVSRCSSCHDLYLPRDETPSKWPDILDDMGTRSKMSAAERSAVERFLTTLAAPRR
jgi:cytochrome c556